MIADTDPTEHTAAFWGPAMDGWVVVAVLAVIGLVMSLGLLVAELRR